MPQRPGMSGSVRGSGLTAMSHEEVPRILTSVPGWMPLVGIGPFLLYELGALTVAVVTKPFAFEGKRRMMQSEQALQELIGAVDTVIVIPNERLMDTVERGTSFFEAFRIADDILRQAVQGISDIITIPGIINRDFADIKTMQAVFAQAYGPFHTYRREVRVADSVCTETITYRLSVPWFTWLFSWPVRRTLRNRPADGASTGWWAPVLIAAPTCPPCRNTIRRSMASAGSGCPRSRWTNSLTPLRGRPGRGCAPRSVTACPASVRWPHIRGCGSSPAWGLGG